MGFDSSPRDNAKEQTWLPSLKVSFCTIWRHKDREKKLLRLWTRLTAGGQSSQHCHILLPREYQHMALLKKVASLENEVAWIFQITFKHYSLNRASSTCVSTYSSLGKPPLSCFLVLLCSAAANICIHLCQPLPGGSLTSWSISDSTFCGSEDLHSDLKWSIFFVEKINYHSEKKKIIHTPRKHKSSS